MSKIIEPKKKKAITVQSIVDEILSKHKNHFADLLENGQMQASDAFTHTDKLYRKAIVNLNAAFPKKVQKHHYELFHASTKYFMESLIIADAKSRILPFLKSVGIAISLITLITVLWML